MRDIRIAAAQFEHRNAGKALPRGEAVLVPFFCDVFVGEPFTWCADHRAFMQQLTARMTDLADEGDFPPWE